MSDVTDQRLTAVRQVSTKGWRVRRGEGGGEGKMEWILICLQQPGCPPPSTTRKAGMHGEYLRWCGPDKTHIVRVGHGWCESPLPRVVTETSARQLNVEEIKRW